MFYGKAISTDYTDFQIGFYPRIIMYNFVYNDNLSDGIAFGVQYNLGLNSEIYLYASLGGGDTAWYGKIKFYQSSISIKSENHYIPMYFTVFG